MALLKRNRLGSYLFAPYGPILDSPEALADCLTQLASQARSLGADWIKFEPIILKGNLSDLLKELPAAGAVKAGRNLEPALTRILDISPTPDELLATISQSTRSMIRKNQRENILTFKTSTNPDDIKIFISMLDVVANRRGIGFFPPSYFINQAKLLMPAKMMFLELAYSGRQPVAAAVMHDYGSIGSYTYAASLPEARKQSASALLLWQAIINAQARGVKQMDLYGIAPDDAPPSHPWYGFSTYKRKFGGQVVELAGTWDLPLTKRYRLYRTGQRLNSILKHR